MMTDLHSLIGNFRHSKTQLAVERCDKRFVVIPAGRRSGKTALAKRRLISSAVSVTDWPDARFFAAAPTRDQAKKIYWADLKEMLPQELLMGRPKESELKITLFNGAEIHVVGMDRPERIEGQPWNGGVLDEYANMKPESWPEHVRPALTDRLGWCWFIGVPEGRNHYYSLYRNAQSPDMRDTWATFTWTAEEALPMYLGRNKAIKMGLCGSDIDEYCKQQADAELAAARRELDSRCFDQEYRGSFVTFEGRVYYQFDTEKHATQTLEYDSRLDLIFCFDFNTSPGVAAVAQEIKGQTHIIGEVWIPKNSTTPAVCRKLIADWHQHPGRVLCYGDATGGAAGSAKIAGSDWDIIRQHLKAEFGERLRICARRRNPSERARVNAVNSRLLSADDSIAMLVDPVAAPHVVRDLDSVVTLAGGSGEIDKNADSELTHISDAVGYYIADQFPVGKAITTRRHII